MDMNGPVIPLQTSSSARLASTAGSKDESLSKTNMPMSITSSLARFFTATIMQIQRARFSRVRSPASASRLESLDQINPPGLAIEIPVIQI